MWEASGVAFVLLFLAELGDKTQLTLIALAVRHRRMPLLAGSAVGFALMTALAVTVGATGGRFVSSQAVRRAAGLTFLVIGLWMMVQRIRKRQAAVEGTLGVAKPRRSGFLAALAAITLLELGDKTQVATVALAARYEERWAVFAGAFLALVLVSALGIFVGSLLAARLKTSWIEWGAAALFVLIGLAALVYP